MKKRNILIGLVAVFFMCFWTCTTKNTESKKLLTVFQNDTQLDSFFTRLHKNHMFNGAVAVKKKGKLIFKKAYGTANFELQTAFTSSTEMEIASVSKQFTAAAILHLQQQGKLNIDNFATEYLGANFPYKNITVYHLLNHTSGLPDYEDYFTSKWDTSKIAYNTDILNYFINSHPNLLSVPGETYHYSNSAYVLLAEIVKCVGGESLDVYLKENVFKLANMEQAGFYDRDTIWQMKNYAPGYMIDPATCSYTMPENLKGKSYYNFLSGRFGSGRLSCSVDDLIKWDSILYTNDFLNEQSKKLAFSFQPPQKDKSNYGFGWHIIKNDSIGKIVYHTGSWAGNLSYIKRYLKQKSVIVILNNTNESVYMKQIRKALDVYVEGKTLIALQAEADDLLKKEICSLNVDNILDWKEVHADENWDDERLGKLQKYYEKYGEDEKAKLVSILIDK